MFKIGSQKSFMTFHDVHQPNNSQKVSNKLATSVTIN